MPAISFKKKSLPFLLQGAGEIAIDTARIAPGTPLDEASAAVFDVGFSGAGNQPLQLGQGDTVALSLSASARVTLTPVFATSKGAQAQLLATYGVGEFFKDRANADKVVLAFETRAAVAGTAAGSFSYAPLKAGANLDAGADAGYAYLRAMDKAAPVEQLLGDYFKRMRLPDQAAAGTQPTVEDGEALFLEYGGYLTLGAEVSAGYALTGSKAMSLGGLALSEKYDFTVAGRVGLKAGVAGRFSILVTVADGLPEWSRVRVRRHRAKDLTVAADVNVGFKNQLDVPADADEFIGAVLGVNARSFLTVFQRARALADFDAFKAATDGLAQRFVAEFIGKAFDTLEGAPEFARALARMNAVVTSYETVEDRSVALFDRYFDRLDALTAFLDRVATIEVGALDRLRRDLTPELWQMLAQLTDGNPLGFLLQQVTVGGAAVESVPELARRAAAALALIQSKAHAGIREAIALARTSFGIDGFSRALARIDTVGELEALANEKAGQFVSRLVGRSLDSAKNVKLAFGEVRAVLDNVDGFKNRLFNTFRQAANSSYGLALHAQYSRASERDVLVDVLIRPGHPRGAEFLRQAAHGDFEEILTTPDTDVVRVQEGVFTHRTTRERAFNVHIVGWHADYRYSGFDRVISQVDQRRMLPSANGITILTTLSVEIDRMRQRQSEEMHVNFLLRALGESADVVGASTDNASFLIDTLTSLTASYRLGFTDSDTSPAELRDYLGFAADLGLDRQGATLEMLDRVLPRAANGGFGRVEASYDVAFGASALEALLSVKRISPAAETAIRTAMRQIVLSNYLKGDEMHDVAFAYATPGVFAMFKDEGPAALTNTSSRSFAIAIVSGGIAAPATVELDRMELNLLVTLYAIEESMVQAIKALYKVLAAGTRITPEEFERRLEDFARALDTFDKFDQVTNSSGVGTSSIFVMFDALVRLAAKGASASVAVLRLGSDAGGKAVEKLFMSDAAAN